MNTLISRKENKKKPHKQQKEKSAVYRDGTTAESTVVNGLLGSENVPVGLQSLMTKLKCWWILNIFHKCCKALENTWTCKLLTEVV